MHRITLLAPTDTSNAICDKWQPAIGQLLSKQLLGKILTIDIHKTLLDQLQSIIPRSTPINGTLYRFSTGADIIRIEIDSEKPDALFRRTCEFDEEKLELQLQRIASAAIKGATNLETTTPVLGGVDWLFSILETDHYIDERELVAPTTIKKAPNLRVADEPEDACETAMWISWTSAQIQSFKNIENSCELTRDEVIEPFLICCAGWKLLSNGSSEAASSINKGAPNDILIRLQKMNASVLIAHHRTLWTTNRYLRKIFAEIDTAWTIASEITAVTGIMSATSELFMADQEARSKRQERILARFGAGLGALAFVSAVVDVFNVLSGDKSFAANALYAIAIPILAVAVLLGILSRRAALDSLDNLERDYVELYEEQSLTRRRARRCTRPSGRPRDP